MSENIPYIIAEDGYYYVAYKEKAPVPEIVVSSKGIANGLSEEYNDGWDFGPDSYSPTSTSAIPYTQTSGILEADIYAQSLAKSIYDVIPIKLIGHFILTENPTFPAVNTIDGDYGSGSGFIPIYPQVAIDGNNAVIDVNYVSTATKLFQPESGNKGYYLGYIKNLLINVNDSQPSGYTPIIMASSLDNVQLENIILNLNTNSDGINNAGTSNIIARNIYINLPRSIGVTTGSSSPTGLRFHNVSMDLGTQGNSVNGFAINGGAGANYIYGGRIEGGNNGIYFDSSSNSINGWYIDSIEMDANTNCVGINQVTNSISKIAFINPIFTDPSGRYINVVAGTVTDVYKIGGLYEGAGVNFPTHYPDSLFTAQANGTTAGYVYMTAPNFSNTGKKYIITFDSYENDTTTDQTVDFPLAFSSYAVIVANNTGLTISASTTGITITAPDSTTTYSGIVIIEGY